MHVLLTDRLSCPRCGPDFGLILLADRVEERRVLAGTLGCANCRDGFPVRDGFGDLRAPPRGELPPGRAGEPGPTDPAEAERLWALLGVAEGPGTLLLAGAAARHAAAVGERIPGVEVVALDADMARWPEAPRVSRMVARPGIPFFSRSLRGVAVDGARGARWLEDAARVAAPLARVVVTDAAEDAGTILARSGLRVLAAEGGTLVAARG
ncbi:MAG: Trm112 family protein [Gemmatimonadetes bacterium]|nr:Trm112 family protein [Gemmatimonadota bacterium]